MDPERFQDALDIEVLVPACGTCTDRCIRSATGSRSSQMLIQNIRISQLWPIIQVCRLDLKSQIRQNHLWMRCGLVGRPRRSRAKMADGVLRPKQDKVANAAVDYIGI